MRVCFLLPPSFHLLLLIAATSATATNSTGVPWDVGVSLGNAVQLFELSHLTEEENRVELPGNDTLTVALLSLGPTTLVHSSLHGNQVTLGLIDLRTGDNQVIHAGSAGPIDLLDAQNQELFYVEDKAVFRQNLGQPLTPRVPILELNDTEITGLALHGPHCILATFDGHHGSILRFDIRSGESQVLAQGLDKVHGLLVQGQELYFLNSPAIGVKNRLERLRLEPGAEPQLLLTMSAWPSALAGLCGRLFWTDLNSRALFALQTAHPPLAPTRLFTFYGDLPYAVTTFGPKDCPLPAQTTEQHTEIPSTTGRPLEEVGLTFDLCGLTDPCNPIGSQVCVQRKTDASPLCVCQLGFHGDKCQFSVGQTAPAYPWPLLGLTVGLGVVVLLLLPMTTFLFIKNRRLGAKPRVKRRFIVQRKPSSQGDVTSYVEIENCCNMSLCETPCFEAPLDKERLIP